MIEPQIHNGQRGVIGEQHGLARLTSTMEALTKGQTAQQQRDTQIQTRLDAVTQQVSTLTDWLRMLLGAVVLLGVLTVGTGGVLWWKLAHLAVVQLVEPQPAPPPLQRQPSKK